MEEKLNNEILKKTRNEMHSLLSEPFPKEVEKELKKGNAYLTYIPVSEVIARLNKVFGVDGWSYEIIKCERDSLDPDFIVAHVRLNVHVNNSMSPVFWTYSCVKDGFGGQKIKRTKNGDIVDLGDEFKGAVSDALKKAAQSLGVGLYLARTEEALSIESEPQINSEIETLWVQFVELSKTLTAEQKIQMSEFWNEYSGGRQKPTKSTATVDELEALIAHCLKLAL